MLSCSSWILLMQHLTVTTFSYIRIECNIDVEMILHLLCQKCSIRLVEMKNFAKKLVVPFLSIALPWKVPSTKTINIKSHEEKIMKQKLELPRLLRYQRVMRPMMCYYCMTIAAVSEHRNWSSRFSSAWRHEQHVITYCTREAKNEIGWSCSAENQILLDGSWSISTGIMERLGGTLWACRFQFRAKSTHQYRHAPPLW